MRLFAGRHLYIGQSWQQRHLQQRQRPRRVDEPLGGRGRRHGQRVVYRHGRRRRQDPCVQPGQIRERLGLQRDARPHLHDQRGGSRRAGRDSGGQRLYHHGEKERRPRVRLDGGQGCDHHLQGEGGKHRRHHHALHTHTRLHPRGHHLREGVREQRRLLRPRRQLRRVDCARSRGGQRGCAGAQLQGDGERRRADLDRQLRALRVHRFRPRPGRRRPRPAQQDEHAGAHDARGKHCAGDPQREQDLRPDTWLHRAARPGDSIHPDVVQRRRHGHEGRRAGGLCAGGCRVRVGQRRRQMQQGDRAHRVVRASCGGTGDEVRHVQGEGDGGKRRAAQPGPLRRRARSGFHNRPGKRHQRSRVAHRGGRGAGAWRRGDGAHDGRPGRRRVCGTRLHHHLHPDGGKHRHDNGEVRAHPRLSARADQLQERGRRRQVGRRERLCRVGD